MSTEMQTKVQANPAQNFTPVQTYLLQRKCAPCNRPGLVEDSKRDKERPTLQRSSADQASTVPPIVHEVLGSSGQPLDSSSRAFMESLFGHDFSRVKVHTDARAAESADAVNAQAYTVGKDVVFGAEQYTPATTSGRRLLAHELTHVLQQDGMTTNRAARLELGETQDTAEDEAKRASESLHHGKSGVLESASVGYAPGSRGRFSYVPPGTVQRQFITPLGQGGGFGGLMDRDRRAAAGASAPVPATPYQVCSRDLQGILGYIGNHAYIKAPPFRYAIISPLCPASWTDNPVTGTTAQKWDNSPDPCGKTPNCVPCNPAPGVTDVGKCLRDAFTAYNNPSLYRGLGPNSNTFAGTLARSCCAGVVPKPAILGNVPGWDDPPAPARAGASPCPPGPTC